MMPHPKMFWLPIWIAVVVMASSASQLDGGDDDGIFTMAREEDVLDNEEVGLVVMDEFGKRTDKVEPFLSGKKRVVDVEPPEITVMNELRSMWHSNPVVTIVDETMFDRFTGAGNHNSPYNTAAAKFDTRPYWLVVLFKSSSAGCNATDAELVVTARRYWKSLEHKRAVSTSRLFFLRVDVANAPGTFRKHKIAKVPSIVLIPPNSTFSREFPSEWFRSPTEDLFQLGQWISFNSGIVFPTSESALGQALQAESLSDTFKYILFAQLVVLVAFNAWRLAYRRTWMILSLGIYSVSISGTIFCFLRGIPPFGMTQAHGLMFIYPDRGGQFWFEGLFIALLSVSISGGLLAAVEFFNGHDVTEEVMKAIDEWERGTGEGGSNNAGNAEEEEDPHIPIIRESPKKRQQRLAKNAIVALTTSGTSFLLISAIYKKKAGW